MFIWYGAETHVGVCAVILTCPSAAPARSAWEGAAARSLTPYNMSQVDLLEEGAAAMGLAPPDTQVGHTPSCQDAFPTHDQPFDGRDMTGW